jgi:archaellum component FlaC
MSSCDILLSKLDNEIKNLTNLAGGLLPRKLSIDGFLDDVIGEDLQDIMDSAENLNNQLDSVTGDLTSAISDCGDPCGIVDECLAGLASSIKGLANVNLPMLDLPSFGSIPVLDSVMGFVDELGGFVVELAGYGISKIVSVMDKYINCLDANPDGPSPGDLQERMDKINNQLDSLNLDPTGEIDLDKIYSGVDQSIRDACDSSYNKLQESKANITVSAKAMIPVSKTKLPQQYI